MALNPDPVISRTIWVILKAVPEKVHKCWEGFTCGRAAHFESNRQGQKSG